MKRTDDERCFQDALVELQEGVRCPGCEEWMSGPGIIGPRVGAWRVRVTCPHCKEEWLMYYERFKE